MRRCQLQLPVLLATLASALSACGPGLLKEDSEEAYSRLHSDSGIRGPAYAQIAAAFSQIAAKFPDRAEFITYGQSVGQRPLIMLKLSQRSMTPTPGAPAVAIAEAIHGDEFLNIAIRLPEQFLGEASTQSGFAQLLAKGGAVYVVPVQNPDGYEARRRANNAGKDLNRDYPLQRVQKAGFTQPETKALAAFIEQDLAATGRKLQLSWDYHCCVGGLIYPWGHSATEKIPADDLTRHRAIGGQVQSIFGYRHGTAMEIVNYTALGASDDYTFEKHKSLSFTFEGAEGSETRKLPQHLTLWNQLFSHVSTLPGGGGAAVQAQPMAIRLVADSDVAKGFVWAGVEKTAAAARLCLGGDCAKSSVTMQFAADSASRRLFKITQSIALQADQLIRIDALNQAGAVVSSRQIRLRAK